MNWWSAFTIGLLSGGIMALLAARLFHDEEDNDVPPPLVWKKWVGNG